MKATFPLALLLSCVGAKPDSDSAPTATLWYATCGDPACQGYTGPYEGVPACTTEVAGAACASAGATCDFEDSCNRVLLCTDEDPTAQEGGCPISRAKYKTGIRYLEPAEREALAAELLGTRLARYRYKTAAGGPERLGFIIDDQPASAAVAPDGEHVDLYAYTSQAVAAIQVQQAQIQALQAQVAALNAELTRMSEDQLRTSGGPAGPSDPPEAAPRR